MSFLSCIGDPKDDTFQLCSGGDTWMLELPTTTRCMYIKTIPTALRDTSNSLNSPARRLNYLTNYMKIETSLGQKRIQNGRQPIIFRWC